MNVTHRGIWHRAMDHAITLGLALVILGLVSVQLFDVAGLAREAYGRDVETAGTLELGSPSGIVAPVLEADLGGTGLAETRGVRASIWLAPIASLRGGVGLGWLENLSPHGAWSERELKLHLGGGLMAPLTPSIGVDLHAGA
ncbi:MAG TPA: hypothetical protein VFP58_09090 [Candidatus Eisenbacteria bacterium]|nr:hypothetical protein [Candidatus Eisenbacteria bacterium]